MADTAEQSACRAALHHHLNGKISKNIARLASATGRRVAVEPVNVSCIVVSGIPCAPSPMVASLLTSPHTLHNMCAEWQLAGSGRKPTKDVNSDKRGAVKKVYVILLQTTLGQGCRDGPDGRDRARGVQQYIRRLCREYQCHGNPAHDNCRLPLWHMARAAGSAALFVGGTTNQMGLGVTMGVLRYMASILVRRVFVFQVPSIFVYNYSSLYFDFKCGF